MHLVDGADILLDPHGVEMPRAAIADYALLCARDCMVSDMGKGRLDLRYRIDVHDNNDRLVHSLPFERAVEVMV